MEFENVFNGIWASTSLLHIPRTETDDVHNRMARVLKQYGILYASFKYGTKEYEKGGRHFNCYDENSISELFAKNEKLKLLKVWVTNDRRTNRTQEQWLKCLVKTS